MLDKLRLFTKPTDPSESDDSREAWKDNVDVAISTNSETGNLRNLQLGPEIRVHINKPLGVVLEENEIIGIMGGAHVFAISPGGNTDRVGKVTVGMFLIEANGENCRGMDFDSIMEILRSSPGDMPVELVFARHVSSKDHSDDESDSDDTTASLAVDTHQPPTSATATLTTSLVTTVGNHVSPKGARVNSTAAAITSGESSRILQTAVPSHQDVPVHHGSTAIYRGERGSTLSGRAAMAKPNSSSSSDNDENSHKLERNTGQKDEPDVLDALEAVVDSIGGMLFSATVTPAGSRGKEAVRAGHPSPPPHPNPPPPPPPPAVRHNSSARTELRGSHPTPSSSCSPPAPPRPPAPFTGPSGGGCSSGISSSDAMPRPARPPPPPAPPVHLQSNVIDRPVAHNEKGGSSDSSSSKNSSGSSPTENSRIEYVSRPPPPPGPPPRLREMDRMSNKPDEVFSDPIPATEMRTDNPTSTGAVHANEVPPPPPPPPRPRPRPRPTDKKTSATTTNIPPNTHIERTSSSSSSSFSERDQILPLDEPPTPPQDDVWQEVRAPTPPPRPQHRPAHFGALTRAAMSTHTAIITESYAADGSSGDVQLEVQFCSMCSVPYSRPPAITPSSSGYMSPTSTIFNGSSSSSNTLMEPSQEALNDHSPRMLNCLHSFCASCVHALLKRSGVSVTCPSCRCATRVGASGVQGLPVSFQLLQNIADMCGNCEEKNAVWRCLNCANDCSLLCEDCRVTHLSMKAFRSHEITPLHSSSRNNRHGHSVREDDAFLQSKSGGATKHAKVYEYCSKHPGKSREVYCSDCQIVMCLSCAVFDHARHSVVPIAEGRQLECEQVKHYVSVLQDKLEVANVELMALQGLLLSLDGKKANIIHTVERLFTGLSDSLDKRERKVLTCIEEQFADKTKQLQAQRIRLQKYLVDRVASVDAVEGVLHLRSCSQVLDSVHFVQSRLQHLNDQNVSSEQLIQADMALMAGSDTFVRSLLPTVGMLRGSHWTACPERCYMDTVDSGIFNGLWWLEIKAVLVNENGVKLTSGGHPISFELVDIEGNVVKERDLYSHSSSISKILASRSTKRRTSSAATLRGASTDVVQETAHGRFVIDDMQGGYRLIFFSKKSCLLSAHVKVFGKHIMASPSVFFFAALGIPEILFGPEKGSVLYASSVHRVNGWPEANIPENLRFLTTAAGWLTDGQGTETLVIGFDGVVSIYQIHFLNWAARKYQLAVRQYDANATEEDEEVWICLRETPTLVSVPCGPSKLWSVTIPEAERNQLGPLDALRLDISEGNNTAFYGVNVEGWSLHGGKIKYQRASSYDDA